MHAEFGFHTGPLVSKTTGVPGYAHFITLARVGGGYSTLFVCVCVCVCVTTKLVFKLNYLKI